MPYCRCLRSDNVEDLKSRNARTGRPGIGDRLPADDGRSILTGVAILLHIEMLYYHTNALGGVKNMFDKLHLKHYNKNNNNYNLNFVEYNKEKGVYVSTNGHTLFIEKTTDEYPSTTHFNMMTGERDDDVNYPDWPRVVPNVGEPLTLEGAKQFQRKADVKNGAKSFVLLGNGTIFNLEYLELILKFCGPDARFYSDGCFSPARVESVDGLRTGVIMPMRIKENEMPNYYEVGSYKPSVKKATRLKTVFIVKNDEGFVRVFDTKAKAEACQLQLTNRGEIITDFIY